jgi:type IV fimbrial biogenesis protein FimT
MIPLRFGHYSNGITLLELLVVIAILGIVAVLAGPGFLDYLSEMKARQSANQLYAAINLAKSEAVTRFTRVTLCKAKIAKKVTDQTCDASASWDDGWVVFTDGGVDDDPGTIGTIDEGEQIIRVFKGLGGFTKVGSGDDITNYISFASSGVPKKADGSTLVETKSHFTVCGQVEQDDKPVFSLSAHNSRILSVSKTGRLQITKPGIYSEVTDCL